MNRNLLIPTVFCGLAVLFSISRGELPSELPGEEITQEYLKWAVPEDTARKQIDTLAKASPAWYDKAAKTWNAPALMVQLSSDRTNVPLGMGGIFVPRFTESGNEPNIEITDSSGHSIVSGEPGRTYCVEPGKYQVMLGSGSHRQRIVRTIDVQESRTTPVPPDWSGLAIETIDSTSTPFKGEYELVRIDKFEPYGRGFGADPNLGESIKTWILKPGTYKILGRGESFNTLRNFVTVRLIPGELTKFLLLQRPDNFSILGGGTVDLTSGTSLTSFWKYGANIGGNIQFSGENDRKFKQQQPVSSILSLRSGLWLTYNNSPYEWESTIRLDEGFNLSDFDISSLTTGADDFRITSLFIWRFLPWFGPYGRTELRTNLLPRRISLDNSSKNKVFITTDSAFDSSGTFQTSPSFSPLTLEIGGGANVDAVSTHYFELKLRAGAASSFNNFPFRYSSDEIDFTKLTDTNLISRVNKSLILKSEKATRIFEFGPQASITGNLRIGRVGIAEAELKIFAPVAPEMRFTRPDFDFSSTLSWRLTSSITLDYDYSYQLTQPKQVSAQVNRSVHTIWLRFSYSSR